jgi:ribosomal protein S18 acetylase RimI-like enzyme
LSPNPVATARYFVLNRIVAMRTKLLADLLIRKFRPADAAAVVDITRLAWNGVTMAELREREVGPVEGKTWQEHKSESVLAQCMRRPDWALVGLVDGEIVGYATMTISAGGEIGAVCNNAVHPRWQGRGIGTALVGEVVRRLEGSGVRLLEVSTLQEDFAARKMYRKLGFAEATRTLHFFRRPAAGDSAD